MALVLADRVRETTTTTGTGTVTLLGAFTGYQSFAAVGNGNTTYYTIAHQTLSEWEVGIGTYTSVGTTLSRTTILSSSNAGAAVAFSAGTKDVFVTQPSSRAVYADGTTLTATNSSVLPVASGGTGLSSTPANGALDIGNGTGFTRATLTAGSNITITNGAGSISIAGNAGTVTSVGQTFTGGLISVAGSPITSSGTLALTVAGTSGGIPYFSGATTWATSAALAANSIVLGGGAGVAPATTTTGTGVVTALGVNTGTAGAFVVNGGVLGTPSSGTLTNCTFPTLNQNTTGTAANVTGIVALTNGGSGQTTAQAAMNTFAAAVTSGSYLRGNGTNVVMSTIQAADVPTLNQNTTGTASNVTGVVAVANGGTGLSTTPANGALNIGNGTGFTRATLTAGSGISITNGVGSITIAATGGGTVTSVGGTGTVNGITLTGTVTTSGNLTLGGTLSGVSLSSQVTGTLPIANGGTGSTTLGAGIGNNGQTWQNVSASRTGNTTYTNSTGQAIFIIAGGHCQPSQEYRLIINGTATGLGNSMGGGMSGDGTIAAIILSGQTYQVSASVTGYVGGGPPYGWWELR